MSPYVRVFFRRYTVKANSRTYTAACTASASKNVFRIVFSPSWSAATLWRRVPLLQRRYGKRGQIRPSTFAPEDVFAEAVQTASVWRDTDASATSVICVDTECRHLATFFAAGCHQSCVEIALCASCVVSLEGIHLLLLSNLESQLETAGMNRI